MTAFRIDRDSDCEECGKEVNTIIVEKCEEYEILDELIKVNAKILTCSECGEEFYSEELDNATLTEAYKWFPTRQSP